jgi:hypothetical protein
MQRYCVTVCNVLVSELMLKHSSVEGAQETNQFFHHIIVVNDVNNICFYLHSQLLYFLLYSSHNMFRPLWAILR